ncbi:amidohydrolase [Natrarchaeobius halalkaliphilus]|uniref:Amidohydrolase n=1 Tax=Natrarchaeobius halalkaliphilus TaxID=1679091 RepID=A0A3N6P0E4_9EURY|nr:amidohydrolase family protein [Natrarchaeobius halalkaliphilus]RQG87928.1 amidohydrolase [Natrarchaeobius halalkaliphilus]
MSVIDSERFPLTDEMEEAFVVDVDFHFRAPVDRLMPYMDSAVVKRNLDITGYPPTSCYWFPGYSTPRGAGGLEAHGELETGEDIVEVMEALGIDMPILTPGYNKLPDSQNVVMKNEISRAYNDYLVDDVLPTHENIKAVALMQQWEPETAVEEIKRVGDEEDIVGMYGFFGHYDLLGQPKYDQVFEELVARDLPLALHGGGTANWPQKDLIGNSLRTWSEAYGLVHPCRAMMMAGNMIMTGVFDKYPELQVVMIEGGVNWVPFVSERLDEMYNDHPEDIQMTERMHRMGQEYLDKQPSEYLEENFSFSSQPMNIPNKTSNFEAMLDMTNASNSLMFATDFPHYTVELHNWVLESPAIDDELAERILHENAESVFRI